MANTSPKDERDIFAVFKKTHECMFSRNCTRNYSILLLVRLTRRIRLCRTRNLLTKSSLLRLILVQIHTKASAIGCIFGFFASFCDSCSEDGSRFADLDLSYSWRPSYLFLTQKGKFLKMKFAAFQPIRK